MKINEMAKYSGVNSETIRKYRDRGLLRPEQNPENGYYEYTHADFLNLLYIRKLRGAGLSLDTIASTCENGDSETILAGYRKTIQELKEQGYLTIAGKLPRRYFESLIADRRSPGNDKEKVSS